jgi:hypothetical protein
MQLTLKATFNDDTQITVSTNLMTIVAWERKYKRKVSQIAEGLGIEDLAFMAYEASRTSGVTVPAQLDEYIKSLKNLEVVEQNSPKADAVPTATD